MTILWLASDNYVVHISAAELDDYCLGSCLQFNKRTVQIFPLASDNYGVPISAAKLDDYCLGSCLQFNHQTAQIILLDFVIIYFFRLILFSSTLLDRFCLIHFLEWLFLSTFLEWYCFHPFFYWFCFIHFLDWFCFIHILLFSFYPLLFREVCVWGWRLLFVVLFLSTFIKQEVVCVWEVLKAGAHTSLRDTSYTIGGLFDAWVSVLGCLVALLADCCANGSKVHVPLLRFPILVFLLTITIDHG